MDRDRLGDFSERYAIVLKEGQDEPVVRRGLIWKVIIDEQYIF